MKRLNNGYIINTSQPAKPFRKKFVYSLILTFAMADMRADISEDNNIVVYKVRRVRLFPEDWFHSLLPSVFMLVLAVIALFHLGWKMTFMIILLAPMPAILNKIRASRREKHKKISLRKSNLVLPHRSRKSEVGSPKSEVGSPKLEVRNPKS